MVLDISHATLAYTQYSIIENSRGLELPTTRTSKRTWKLALDDPRGQGLSSRTTTLCNSLYLGCGARWRHSYLDRIMRLLYWTTHARSSRMTLSTVIFKGHSYTRLSSCEIRQGHFQPWHEMQDMDNSRVQQPIYWMYRIINKLTAFRIVVSYAVKSTSVWTRRRKCADRYDTVNDTIEEFNMDSKAEYSALSSTRSQKKKLKQTTPVPL